MRSFGFRRNSGAPREHVLEGHRMIPTGAGPVEYATVGEGPPILVLHGAGARPDPGVAPARGLALEGFHLISPSRFGCLGTPFPPDAPLETEADAWASLLDALGIARVRVLAFSGGGGPAARLAIRHPDRVSALVLMVPRAFGITAQHPVSSRQLDWPLWVLMRGSSAYSMVGVPASCIPSLPRHERAELAQCLANFQSPNGMKTPTLLVSAYDDLYRILPVAPQAAGPNPHRQPEPLSRGHEVWPAVAAFLWRAIT